MGIVWRYFLDIPEWGLSIMGYIDMMENTCWEYQWIHHPKTVHHIQLGLVAVTLFQLVFLSEWRWLLTRRWLGSTAKITMGCHGNWQFHGDLRVWVNWTWDMSWGQIRDFPQRCSKPRVRPHKKTTHPHNMIYSSPEDEWKQWLYAVILTLRI